MALIYCERLVRETKGRLCIQYDNWRSILFACLVIIKTTIITMFIIIIIIIIIVVVVVVVVVVIGNG